MNRFLGCAILLALLSCGRRPLHQVSVNPALAKLVSPDVEVLAQIDLEALKTTSFYLRHKSQLDNPLLTALASQTGFDPRRDLSKLLVTWNGKHLLFVAKGSFARQLIEQRLAASTPHAPYKSYSIFGNARQAFVLLDSATVVAGTKPAVQSAIDLFEQHTGQVPPDFTTALDQLSEADQIWLVSRGSLPFADAPTRSDLVSILSNFAGYVNSTSVGIFVDSGLHFKAQIDCISVAGAKRVSDGLRAGIGLARLGQKTNQPPWSTLYPAIHVRLARTSVYVQADISPELSDNLLNATTGIYRPR